jgi:hypothetical protein
VGRRGGDAWTSLHPPRRASLRVPIDLASRQPPPFPSLLHPVEPPPRQIRRRMPRLVTRPRPHPLATNWEQSELTNVPSALPVPFPPRCSSLSPRLSQSTQPSLNSSPHRRRLRKHLATPPLPRPPPARPTLPRLPMLQVQVRLSHLAPLHLRKEECTATTSRPSPRRPSPGSSVAVPRTSEYDLRTLSFPPCPAQPGGRRRRRTRQEEEDYSVAHGPSSAPHLPLPHQTTDPQKLPPHHRPLQLRDLNRQKSNHLPVYPRPPSSAPSHPHLYQS